MVREVAGREIWPLDATRTGVSVGGWQPAPAIRQEMSSESTLGFLKTKLRGTPLVFCVVWDKIGVIFGQEQFRDDIVLTRRRISAGK